MLCSLLVQLRIAKVKRIHSHGNTSTYASARAIKPERLRTIRQRLQRRPGQPCRRQRRGVARACSRPPPTTKAQRALPRDFSIELKQGSITNQRRSGRCWMFASLNTLRYELMHQLGISTISNSPKPTCSSGMRWRSRTRIWRTCCATLDEPTDQPPVPGDQLRAGRRRRLVADVRRPGETSTASCRRAPTRNPPTPRTPTRSNNTSTPGCASSPPTCATVTQRRRHGRRAARGQGRRHVHRVPHLRHLVGRAAGEVRLPRAPKDDDEDKKGEARKCKAEADADGKAESCKCGESCKCEGKSDAKACKCDKDKSDKPKTGKDERPQIREIGITPLEFYKKYVPVDVNDFVTLCQRPAQEPPVQPALPHPLQRERGRGWRYGIRQRAAGRVQEGRA